MKHVAVAFYIGIFIFNSIQVHAQQDSLTGFDRQSTITEGSASGLQGFELRQYLYVQEQKFILKKYKLEQNSLKNPSILPFYPSVCDGTDFEFDNGSAITFSNQLQAWGSFAGFSGFISSASTSTLINYFPGGLSNPSSCNLIGCCPMPPTASSVIVSTSTTPYFDSQIGLQYPIYSVFGSNAGPPAAAAANPQFNFQMKGNKFLCLNNELIGDYGIASTIKSYTVTPSNYFFAYAFIWVTQPEHACCDAASAHFKVWNNTQNTLVTSLSNTMSAPSSACSNSTNIPFFVVGTGAPYIPNTNVPMLFSPWQVRYLDLTPYMGQLITIEVIAADCDAGGHFSRLYFDAQCSDLQIVMNTDSIMGQCPGATTLSANPYVQGATWLGPGNFSSNSATCVPNVSGIYTLVVNQNGGAVVSPTSNPLVSTRTVNVQFFPPPIVSPLSATVCAGQTSTISILGTQTCTWSNGTTSSTFTDVISAPGATYNVTGIDTNGCAFSVDKKYTTVVDEVFIGPIDTLICAGNAINLSSSFAMSYSWSSGSTGSSIVVSPSVTTTYTLTGLGFYGCVYSETVQVYVDKCTGMEEYDVKSNITISPNPVKRSESLVISGTSTNNLIRILNTDSKLVLQQNADAKKSIVQLSALDPGIYIIEVICANKVLMKVKVLVAD